MQKRHCTHFVTDNPAHSTKVSGDGIALVEEGRIEDGGRNEKGINRWIVFRIGLRLQNRRTCHQNRRVHRGYWWHVSARHGMR